MIKTSKTKLFKAVGEFTEWIKKDRNSKKTGELMKMANAKLSGHYNYFDNVRKQHPPLVA